MRKHRACLQGLISCGLFGVLFGCSTTDTTIPLPPTDQLASDRTNLPTHTGTAVVSTEGAVIATGAAEVVIPRGALAEPVEIVVQAAETGFGEIPNAEEEQVLAFLPHGTQFLKPVTIHIPHEHVSVEGLSLFTSEPDQPWSVVSGATFTDEYAAADVTHFSFFFASPTPEEEIVTAPDSNGGAGGSSSTAGSGGTGGSDTAVAGAGGSDSLDNTGGTTSNTAGSTGNTAGSTGNTAGSTGNTNDGEGGAGGDAGVPSLAGSAGQSGEAGGSNTAPDGGVAGGFGAGGASSGAGGSAGTSGNLHPDAGFAGGYGEGGEAGSTSTGAGGSSLGLDAGGGTSTGGGDANYLDNGEWHGHLYSLADEEGSIIDRTGICVEGVVGVGESSYALWGWNVNQEFGSQSFQSWDPNADSLVYNINLISGGPVLLQLIDDQDDTYCLEVNDGFGVVEFADFDTGCGFGVGTFYEGTPIVHAQVLVPGNELEEQPFDFCVHDILPLTGHVDPGGGSGPDAGAGGSAGAAGGSGTAGSGPDAGGPGGYDPNYLDNGEWRGHLYSSAGDDSSINRNGICAAGVVGESETSYALWGWNVNQQKGSLINGSWDPNAESLLYDISASFGEPLQLQLIDDQNVTYCLDASDGFGVVLLTDFSTDCGQGAGTFYNGTRPIVHAQVVVPSQLVPQEFDFCVYDILPLVDHSEPGGGGGMDAGGGTTTGGGAVNYLDKGEWRGHLYSHAEDQTSSVDRYGMCAEGVVGAGESNFALWGWNISQDEGSMSVGSWLPTSEGIRYDVSAGYGEPLRLQVVDSTGQSYCRVLEDEFGIALFGEFNTKCWDSSGVDYNGSASLRSVELLVPGNASDAQLYDMCVHTLDPVTDGGGSGGAGSGGSSGGQDAGVPD